MQNMTQVLTVEREWLEKFRDFSGGVETMELYELYNRVRQQGKFMEQEAIEEDKTKVQVVTGLIIQRGEKLWVMRRNFSATDKRLTAGTTLCITDHVFLPEGNAPKDVIVYNTKNLWHRSIWVEKSYQAHLVAAIWDKGSEVEQYHLGLMFFVGMARGIPELRTPDYTEGRFLSMEGIAKIYDQYDNWSRVMLAALADGKFIEELPGAHLKFLAHR